ncbi:MAG: carbamoyltransferase HypF [Syntrophobacteraceae bacterium]|nr:carbamoyltransferase HypF [Syntrophobacteraceae bacterium]
MVKVRGIVQGVGFRPFIYQLAGRCRLNGWVRNQSDGVEIEVEGPPGSVATFIRSISSEHPPLARITAVETADLPYRRLEGFTIEESRAVASRSTLISPDVCTCSDCLRELFSPNDRRFRYPFINCTNCGPRYTIIKDIPYDRKNTTMARFTMCPQCLAEYGDPVNRRFHAQPNGCPQCGPQVWLEDSRRKVIATREDAVRKTTELLDAGAVVAVKGLGGFHLAVGAFDEGAVRRLRGRKVREEKPFAVMFSKLEDIALHCRLNSGEEELLQSPARPIVLLLKHRDRLGGAPRVAPSVAPKNNRLGVFLPYTPLHFLLFYGAPGRALVMTSGNRSDEPIVYENEDARLSLAGIADYFLFHDRDIFMRCDDSVAVVRGGRARCVRRARGYAPVPVFLADSCPTVLGVGAELKNTVCLTRGKSAFLSPHTGDLENLETLRSFDHSILHLERILEIRPELIVHDMHPDYLNTRWALKQRDLPVLAVQHHHAHIGAVMAENGIDGPVIGLALDGTGFGADATIWGGEVLRVDKSGFERLAHFKHVPLPGGAKAIKEPWRMALGYLWTIDPESVASRFADLLAAWPARDVPIILRMLSRGLNCPLTSSCGRLFDAAAALCGVCLRATYEGQAAIEFEQAIEPDDGCYHGKIETTSFASSRGKILLIDQFPIIEALVEDLRQGVPVARIAARFHNGIVHILGEAVGAACALTGINRVALGGGVFQNGYLCDRLEKELLAMGLGVFSHAEVPPNDACISLGQAWIGAQRLLAKEEHLL